MLEEGEGRKIIEGLRHVAELLATPINFEQLITDGVLRKAARGWYEILDARRLPEHARHKVNAIKYTTRKGSDGEVTALWVKFMKHTDKFKKHIDGQKKK